MHRILAIFFLLIAGQLQLPAHGQQLNLEREPVNSPQAPWALTQNDVPVKVPPEVNEGLQAGGNVTALSPDQRYLVFQNDLTLSLWDRSLGTVRELMTLHADHEGQSGVVWHPYSTGDTQAFAFVNVNRKRYPTGTKTFVLRIRSGELTEKIKLDLLMNLPEQHPPVAGKDFEFLGWDRLGFTHKNRDELDYFSEVDLDFPQRLKAAGRSMGITVIGNEASSFYYGLQYADRTPVQLPTEVSKAILKFGGEISPDERYIIFDDFPRIRLYDFEKKQVTDLMSVFGDSEGLHSFLWKESSDWVAFVNINQDRYGAKIFALKINQGALAQKVKADENINFVCGSMCVSEAGHDFWWNEDGSLGFLYHQAIEENEGRKGEVKISE